MKLYNRGLGFFQKIAFLLSPEEEHRPEVQKLFISSSPTATQNKLQRLPLLCFSAKSNVCE
jgi:hypothetical protein